MMANPISFQEIDAYSRLNGIAMTAWEVSLIRRIDTAALAAAEKRAAKRKLGEPLPKFEVEASDGRGVKAMLRGFSPRPKGNKS